MSDFQKQIQAKKKLTFNRWKHNPFFEIMMSLHLKKHAKKERQKNKIAENKKTKNNPRRTMFLSAICKRPSDGIEH